MSKKPKTEKLLKKYGARYGVVRVSDIRFDPAFRAACQSNACGHYGACWMCPPDVGEIDALIRRAQSFTYALVFSGVYPIEDSFDIEGMQKAAKAHNRLIRRLREEADEANGDILPLGAGACGGCSVCAKQAGEPCRHPSRAVIPLEAAGVDVTHLAKLADLPYNNGAQTATFFGAILYR